MPHVDEDGCPYILIEGVVDMEPVTGADYDVGIEHTSHAEFMEKLVVFGLPGTIFDVWQTIDGEPLYLTDGDEYERMVPDRKVCVWFKYHERGPVPARRCSGEGCGVGSLG